jgi:peptidyl-tRNA hydrolase
MSDKATPARALTFVGDSEHTTNTNERLTQYIVLRRDLWREKSWPLGSICAQVAHASVAALETFKDHEDTKTYVSAKRLQSMTKVVLEVKGEPQLLTLSKKLTENKIEHYAWREQPEDYVTCLALRPYRKEEVKGLLKKCNLASDVRQAEEEDISVH